MTDHSAVGVEVFIAICAIISICFACFQFYRIKIIPLELEKAEKTAIIELSDSSVQGGLEVTTFDDQGAEEDPQHSTLEVKEKLIRIHNAIASGARSFLHAEYLICFGFVVIFGIVVLVMVGAAGSCYQTPKMYNATGNLEEFILTNETKATMESACWIHGSFTSLAFVLGAVTSMICGYIGMMVAVYTNVRTAVAAKQGWGESFESAFRGGAVMGFALSGLGLVVLLTVIVAFRPYFEKYWFFDEHFNQVPMEVILFEVVTGYGLGGSTIALFGRVGGGIYTKAADVGADLVGKIEFAIPEDDPRNPATIADNVGDNVGDVAGMGADLFGSFAESTCAALAIASSSPQIRSNFGYMLLPLTVSAIGMLACIATSFVATNIRRVEKEGDVEKTLKLQLVISTSILTPILLVVCGVSLPNTFCFSNNPSCTLENNAGVEGTATWWGVAICTLLGLWSGLLTGLVTEYYTSHSYRPVREVAESCQTGAATNVIYGLALGYKSTIVPVILLGITIFGSFYLSGMYGVALAALGMLSSLSIGLTIDAYGPITDNAGGIAEMCNLGSEVRIITDGLDAAGNTTAAIGKGFAIGSAALVSIALFSAFVTRIGETDVNILKPIVFSFLIIGAMLPYWFSAMTMKSVGVAAGEMVKEVRRQFETIEGLLEGTADADHERCVEIATKASLREMIAPGCLVIFTPILVGSIFGVHALTGLLAGAIASAIQMAISSSNTGGAWDNAKKYIEKGNLGGKGSSAHKAAVVGDTVGDPLKDTSGPALNILMKLMAIISLVFADFFAQKAATKGQEWAGY